jgi:hypothetical protein
MFENFESNLFMASEEDVRAARHEVRVDADDGDILKTFDI